MNFIIQKLNFKLKNQRNESIDFIQSFFSNVERTISNIKDLNHYIQKFDKIPFQKI